MNASANVPITQIVGSGICVSIEDGNRVHDVIVDRLNSGERVVLSFLGVSRMTTAFLNAAVGQLYNEYDEATVRSRLAPPIDASQDHLRLLKRVVDNAKIFFSNQDLARKALANQVGDE